MRGRQVDNRSVALRQRIRAQAALVQRQRAHHRPIRLKNLVQLAVARILQPVHTVAPQKLDDQLHQVFRPRADQDVVGRHPQPPAVPQVACNLLTQFDRAAGVGRAQQTVGVFAQHAAAEPRPRRKGKAAVIDNIGAEVIPATIVRRGSGLCRRRRHRRYWAWHGQLRLHEVAAPRLGREVSLGQQLAISRFDRDLADMQVGGQLALAGQALAARERPRHDIRAHRAVKLLVERCAAVWVKMIGQHATSPLT